MAKISRIGDKNQAGGAIMRGASSVFANGKKVGLKGSQISEHAPYGPPHPPHVCAVVSVGSPTVFAEGSPVARVGSGNSCGHSIVEGSDNVFVP
jgi:uncharacterized Zn-binding protein involved in type VI secretion